MLYYQQIRYFYYSILNDHTSSHVFSCLRCFPLLLFRYFAENITCSLYYMYILFCLTILYLLTVYNCTCMCNCSTLSSWLSGSAANCWEDMLKWKLNHLQETRKTLINKLLGKRNSASLWIFKSPPKNPF